MCIQLMASIACELGFDLCYFDAEQGFVQFDLEGRVDAFAPGMRGPVR